MQRPDGELQRLIREYDNPIFGYRRGDDGEIEKDIFDAELPEGWVDTPAALAPMAVPQMVETPAAEGLAAPYDTHGFKELAAELKRRTGAGPQVGTNTETLIGMLQDLDAAAAQDGGGSA